MLQLERAWRFVTARVCVPRQGILGLLAGAAALVLAATVTASGEAQRIDQPRSHAAAAAIDADQQALRPRRIPGKPVHTDFDPARHETHVILVKFRDDLPVRLRDGALSDLGTGAMQNAQPTLAQLAAGTWQRWVEIPEARVDAMRAKAEAKLQRAMADINTYFHYFLTANMDAAQVIDLLNALDVVELAQPAMKPVPSPIPPNFVQFQGYLNNPATGVGASMAWNDLGTRGDGVTVCDLEYHCNPNHLDVDVTFIGPAPQIPPGFDLINEQNHGIAVAGVISAHNNGWGTTGIASDVEYLFTPTYYNNSYNPGGALFTAANALEPGDIIVVEQQLNSGLGYVPVEWWGPLHEAITIIVAQDIMVIEAAGNGNQNLNVGVNAEGSHNHFPFIPANDSGAIIVGAGAAPAGFGGSDVDRSRLGFSTYGTRVDLQGWGESVFTTGYGSWYSSEGVNLWYTAFFAGTSSATPVVAGACALLQSAHMEQFGEPIEPVVLREALVATGSPQQAGSFPVTQNIGPRPNVIAAFDEFTVDGDFNNDRVVDEEDRALLCGAMGLAKGQDGFISEADLNNDNVINHDDLAIFNSILPPCLGDVVTSATLQPPADGIVNAADLAFLLGNWGQNETCADFAANDFDQTPDGFVNAADLAVLLGGWGPCE